MRGTSPCAQQHAHYTSYAGSLQLRSAAQLPADSWLPEIVVEVNCRVPRARVPSGGAGARPSAPGARDCGP